MELKSIHRPLNWKIVTKVRFAHEIVIKLYNKSMKVNQSCSGHGIFFSEEI